MINLVFISYLFKVLLTRIKSQISLFPLFCLNRLWFENIELFYAYKSHFVGEKISTKLASIYKFTTRALELCSVLLN